MTTPTLTLFDRALRDAMPARGPMTKPRIYTVLSFRKNEDGTRTTHAHMVAAFSGKEAEAEFLETADHDLIAGCELFISTDAIREMSPHSNVCLFVSGASDNPTRDRVNDSTFHSWMRAVTRDEWHDGEFSPANYRRIAREEVPA